jgi:hypothetical protein
MLEVGPELRRAPATALMLDIWTRRRAAFGLVAVTTAFACLFNLAYADSFGRNTVQLLHFMNVVFLFATIVPLLMIFSYQEVKATRVSTGFPTRFFALPLTSLQLVVIPMVLGVIAMGLFWLTWTTFIKTFGDSRMFGGFLLVAWLAWSQTVLWLPAKGPFRLTAVGIVWLTFVHVALTPVFPQHAPWWLKGNTVIGLLVGSALAAFVLSWILVARQRSGGSGRGSIHSSLERVSGILPKRIPTFDSPAAAHYWFEWQRSGYQLPRMVAVLLIGTLLSMVVIPLVSTEGTEDALEGLVLFSLMMPIILAFLLGRPLSKPDFWASDLAVPSFIAAKPLATEEIIAAKMKAAARSTVLTWLLVLAFLAASFPLWRRTDLLSFFWMVWWPFQDYPGVFQVAMGAASLLACMFLTWRFLVASLWLGLSGSRKMRALSALPFVLLPALLVVFHDVFDRPQPLWGRHDFDEILSVLIWTAAAAAIAKFWLSAVSWRNVSQARVRQYLIFWIVGTACMVVLAIVLSPAVLVSVEVFWRHVLPADAVQVRTLLILLALMAVPFARPGLATFSLDRNRHQ